MPLRPPFHRPIHREIHRPLSSPLAGGGGGGPAFSPLHFYVGHVGAWWDARDITAMWQQSDGTSPVTTDVDPVGRMDDLTGQGHHALQTVANSRPRWKVAGHITLDGLDDSWSCGDADAFSFGTGTTDSPCTLSAHASVTGGNGTFLTRYDTSKREYSFGYTGTTLIIYIYDQSALAFLGRSVAGGIITGSFHEYSMTYDGSASGVKLYRDGIRIDTTNQVVGSYVAMENLDGALQIGASSGAFGGPSNMNLRSALLINRELTAEELIKLTTYNTI